MARSRESSAAENHAGIEEIPSPRCPRCGDGDLFAIEVTGRAGGVRRGSYCAGRYDRDRRRFVRRSCGYSALRLEANSSPGFQRGSASD